MLPSPPHPATSDPGLLILSIVSLLTLGEESPGTQVKDRLDQPFVWEILTQEAWHKVQELLFLAGGPGDLSSGKTLPRLAHIAHPNRTHTPPKLSMHLTPLAMWASCLQQPIALLLLLLKVEKFLKQRHACIFSHSVHP